MRLNSLVMSNVTDQLVMINLNGLEVDYGTLKPEQLLQNKIEPSQNFEIDLQKFICIDMFENFPDQTCFRIAVKICLKICPKIIRRVTFVVCKNPLSIKYTGKYHK